MRSTAAGAAHEETAAKEKLLNAATDLFTRRGYSATSVREIVAAAGVTKPVLYYHFGSKEGIYRAIMDLTQEAFNVRLEKVRRRGGPAGKKLQSLLEEVFDLFLERLSVVRLIFAIYYGPHQGAPDFDFNQFDEAFRKSVLEIVREGVKSGEFRKGRAEDMALVVMGTFSVATELELSHAGRGIGRNGLARLLRLVLNGIAYQEGKVRAQ